MPLMPEKKYLYLTCANHRLDKNDIMQNVTLNHVFGKYSDYRHLKKFQVTILVLSVKVSY